MKSEINPYVVISNDGIIVSILQTNEKGYKKSIENNQIWAVNPETQRLLPVYDFGQTSAFSEKDGWYEVTVNGKETGDSKVADNTNNDVIKADKDSKAEIIDKLFAVIEKRKEEMPEGSYTTHLFNSGMSKIKKKTGEEAIELLLAEGRDEIIFEAADLIYHMLVLLSASEINPEEIFKELENRDS